MGGQAGFFEVDESLKDLSAKGDALERLSAIVDFELFRPDLMGAVPRSDGAKGGRPPFGLVFMFAASRCASGQGADPVGEPRAVGRAHRVLLRCPSGLIKDRQSFMRFLAFMRFLGLGLSDPVPDANTVLTFREALTRAQIEGRPAIQVLFAAYEAALRAAEPPRVFRRLQLLREWSHDQANPTLFS